jgi:ATP-independent RNA helicase DbpA
VTLTSFNSLPLRAELLQNLETLGFTAMTPIQAQSLPVILQGRDLIAQAKTGSGKTAAFGLGVLNTLEPTRYEIQAMVLCPTRELADQVAQELRRLARALPNIKILSLVGGTPIRGQLESLAQGAHIVVGTPGRILDHLERESIKLSFLKTLVLDEADRMVDMGFYDDILAVAKACPTQRQTVLFSATYPEDIRRATSRLMRDPVQVEAETEHAADQIVEHFYEIEDDGRVAAVMQLLGHFRPGSALAFCNTKARCRELADTLRVHGVNALALHGDLEQRERDEVLVQFANRSCSVLVATDVAARGLDIPALDAVINVEVTRDTEVHVHRIGRTGRAGEKGLSLSLVSPDEMQWAIAIEKMQNTPIQWSDISKLPISQEPLARAPMRTMLILGGKRDKLRPGDLLGALTGEAGYAKDQIGKINIIDAVSYVAIDRRIANDAMNQLANGTIKGKRFRVRLMPDS